MFDHLQAEMIEHFRADPENERCGYITTAGIFLPIPNVSEDTRQSFLMGRLPDNAAAVVHSHPGGPHCPSADDMRQQYATALPWGIYSFDNERECFFWFGDDVPEVPLLVRPFRHGVTDCYALVRDTYRQVYGVELPDFPRDWEWWNTDVNLFENGYEQAGFKPVEQAEALPADVLLFSIRSDFVNHSGVYLEGDLILHHLSAKTEFEPARMPTIEPVARYLPFLKTVLRHENYNFDRTAGQEIWAPFLP